MIQWPHTCAMCVSEGRRGTRRLGFLLVVVAGCTHGSALRHNFENRLAPHAAFELHCPQPSLRIAPMNIGTLAGTDIPLYQRVEGCGIHATYMAKGAGYALIYVSGGSMEVPSDFGAICGSGQERH